MLALEFFPNTNNIIGVAHDDFDRDTIIDEYQKLVAATKFKKAAEVDGTNPSASEKTAKMKTEEFPEGRNYTIMMCQSWSAEWNL